MKIKRTRPFLDTLELEDEDKQLTIVVNIHFERSAPLIRKAQVALIEAEKAIQHTGTPSSRCLPLCLANRRQERFSNFMKGSTPTC